MSETEDGEWIRVRYLGDQDDPLFAGTEDLAHRDEVDVLMGVAHKDTWGDRVTIIVHHVPESEADESGYEAVTIVGVPYGVSITSDDRQPDLPHGVKAC